MSTTPSSSSEVVAGGKADTRPGTDLLFLALAAAAFALAQTAIVPALNVLSADLNASSADVGWVLTGYLISAAILTPVFGRLGDIFGKKRMLLLSLGLFALGSGLAALSPSIWFLVAARVLQGAGGGIVPLCLGIIGDTFSLERRGSALGVISALAGIGAGGGLLLGGLLVDHTSWHWIFWVGTAMAVVAMLGALRLPDSTSHAAGKVDILGVVVLAIGLTTPLLGLSRTATWGWGDARTLGLIFGGLVVLVGFVLLELRTAEPLIDMRVLGRPAILIANIAMLIFGAGMFGVFALIPQLAQTPDQISYGLGLGATGAGALLTPGAVVMLVAAVVTGRLTSRRIHPSFAVAAGAFLAALGLALLALKHGSVATIIIFSMVVFAGIGMGMAVMPNLVMSAAPAGKTGEATGVNALVRSVGSSIGSQIVATVLAANVMTVGNYELPSDDAFSIAFWLVAGAALLAGIVALFIPRRTVTVSTPPGSTRSRDKLMTSEE